MSDEITRFIISHTTELCSNVISGKAEGKAEGKANSIAEGITSTIEIADYTVTISISKKQSVLGKRRHEIISQASHELKASQITKKEELGLYNHNTKYKRDTSSDASLYNSFGHNFLDM